MKQKYLLQHLNFTFWRLFVDESNALAEDRRATVRQIVPVDRSDDAVAKAESHYCLRKAFWLTRIEPGGLAACYCTISASSSTDVTEDHEGGRFTLPAVADVWAVGLFADRVQLGSPQDAPHAQIVWAARPANPEPVRQVTKRLGFVHAVMVNRAIEAMLSAD